MGVTRGLKAGLVRVPPGGTWSAVSLEPAWHPQGRDGRPVLSLPRAVSVAGGGQGGRLMGESRAALGAGLGGFQREPEPTLPEKPSELLTVIGAAVSLGRQGVGKWLPVDHTPRGDLCRMHTAHSEWAIWGRCGQADSQVPCGPWG